MNVKLITKALHTLSLLSEEDYDLVLKLRALTEDERGLLMTVLEPSKPAGKKAGKKSSKSSSSKSPRASSLSSQLKSRTSEQREAATKDDDEDGPRCVFTMSDDAPCSAGEHSPIHREDGGYLSWHPFQASVPTAPTQSSANGASSATERSTRRSAPPSTPESDDGEERGASLSGANSEAGAASAGAATGGSSE